MDIRKEEKVEGIDRYFEAINDFISKIQPVGKEIDHEKQIPTNNCFLLRGIVWRRHADRTSAGNSAVS